MGLFGLSKGDRVIAVKDIAPGLFGGAKVPKGTKGRIATVEDGLFSTKYHVRFDNDEIEECSDSEIDEL